MLNTLISFVGFIIAIVILVGFHEFGHYYAARKVGIKVLRFSIGFGKTLLMWKGKDGCEYTLAAIPLGGYVAMLDERERPVAPEERAMAFNTQPIWKRFVVIAAGPFANILLAFVLLLGLYLYGLPGLKSEIGQPLPNTPFAAAGLIQGDQIIAVENKSVTSFDQLVLTLIDNLWSGQTTLTVLRDDTELHKLIDLGQPLQLDGKTNLETLLGLRPNFPLIRPIIGEVSIGLPADQAGLRADDEIIQLNGEAIQDWTMLVNRLQTIPLDEYQQPLPLVLNVKRGMQYYDITLRPVQNADKQWVIGIGLSRLAVADFQHSLQAMMITQRLSFIDSVDKAKEQTWAYGMLVFNTIGRMLTGDVKISAMSGPLTMADLSGKALSSGLVSFISLMALFSVNIGVMNLVPIPVLDGGRLVGLCIEAILGKRRISPQIGVWCLKIGAIVMICFMGIVIFYDVLRQFGL